jgi:hypothetical protein
LLQSRNSFQIDLPASGWHAPFIAPNNHLLRGNSDLLPAGYWVERQSASLFPVGHNFFAETWLRQPRRRHAKLRLPATWWLWPDGIKARRLNRLNSASPVRSRASSARSLVWIPGVSAAVKSSDQTLIVDPSKLVKVRIPSIAAKLVSAGLSNVLKL